MNANERNQTGHPAVFSTSRAHDNPLLYSLGRLKEPDNPLLYLLGRLKEPDTPRVVGRHRPGVPPFLRTAVLGPQAEGHSDVSIATAVIHWPSAEIGSVKSQVPRSFVTGNSPAIRPSTKTRSFRSGSAEVASTLSVVR
jgi:hypothetical protein